MASEQGLARVLLGIARTEDRVISTLLDHQTRQELSCGTQIVEVEQVTLSLLHKLLTEPEAGASMMSGPMGNAVSGGEVTLLADPGLLSLLPPQARAIWLLYFAVDRESEHHVLGPLSPPNCQHQTSEGPRKENVEEALFL